MSTSAKDPAIAARESEKRRVAEAALAFVVPGEPIGIGTGSTANAFIDLLAERFGGRIPGAVPSSQASAARLAAKGIPLCDLNDLDGLGLYVDGADEFEPRGLALVKGGGGALTREKIVAECAARFVCIVDASKRVERLGRFPLPLEVLPLAERLVMRRLRALGGEPRPRRGFVTDNGHGILDVHGLVIDDPAALEAALEVIPGVVTCGLFARRPADVVLMAGPAGVERFDRVERFDPVAPRAREG